MVVVVSVYSSPLSLGGKWVSWGVWVGSGRFEPKEHRRRKDQATFVVGVLGGGISIPSRLGGLAERSKLGVRGEAQAENEFGAL